MTVVDPSSAAAAAGGTSVVLQEEAAGMAEIRVPMAEDILVALGRLYRSESNVRKARSREGIEELAALIASQGLLHRLFVVAESCDGEPRGRYAVAAGSRRLEAMEWLAVHDWPGWDATTPVPCRLFASEQALSVSLAENSGRLAMHPADQFEAFNGLLCAGLSVHSVALRFGVTPLTVERRMKLARVAPFFLEKYRAGEVSLEQLETLAVVDDHQRQIDAWNSLGEYQRSSTWSLRQVLLSDAVASNDRRAEFVGLAGYEAAGGEVKRDLFSEEEGGLAFLSDAALLDRLCMEKMEPLSQTFKDAGWSWVEVSPMGLSYHVSRDYESMEATPGRFTKQEQGAYDEIEAMVKLEQQRLEALEQQAERCGTLTDEQEQEAAAIEDTCDQLENFGQHMQEAVQVWTAEQRRGGGVFLSLDFNGSLEVSEGWRARKSAAHEDDGERVPGRPARPAKDTDATKPALPDSLTRALTAQRTLAIAAALAQRPNVALAAVVYQLIASTGHDLPNLPLKLSASDGIDAAARTGEADEQAPALVALAKVGIEVGNELPTEPAQLMQHLLNASQDELLQLLALHVARSTDAVRGNEWHYRIKQESLETAFLNALDFDMADWWQPSGPAFLSRVTKAKMIEAVAEARSAEAAAPLVKMKKAEAVAFAEAKLKGTRWIPAVLRGPRT